MSIKNLFEESANIFPNSSLDELTSSVESPGFVLASSIYKKKNFPNLNFSVPSQFCKFGLAKEYYNNAFSRIYDTFPYDGSQKEVIEWHNSSSYLDDYVFNNLYPKTNGSIYFSSSVGALTDTVDTYNKKFTNIRYVQMSQSGPLVDNIYLSSTRESNIGFYPETGYTVQFWMKKDSYIDTTNTTFECATSFHTTSGSVGNPVNIFAFQLLGSDSTKLLIGGGLGAQNQSSGTFTITEDITDYNHYTVVVSYTNSSGHKSVTNLWVNGNRNATSKETTETGLILGQIVHMTGNIGSICSSSLDQGYNPLYDTHIDEFRFFKRALTEEEIKKNWFCHVHGGTNSDNDVISSSLGLYYRFNEGITQTSSIDANIIDYSGRNTNAYYVGYSSSFRLTASAFDSYGLKEIADPVLYYFHPDVSYTQSYYSDIGQEYDYRNDDSFLNLFPEHIQDDDYEAGEELKKLSHVIGVQFDELFVQIGELTKVKSVSHLESGSYNYDICTRLLSSNGLEVSDIFSQITENEFFENKDDRIVFDRKIEKIKSILYKNIYNNLLSIYKSKGSELSIRSVFRSFGVDDDLLKIKIYADKEKFKLNNNRYITTRKKKCLDLTGIGNYSNIFGNVSPFVYNSDDSEVNYLESGADYVLHAGLCYENTMFFPRFTNPLENHYTEIPTNYLSASLFGMMPIETSGTVFVNEGTEEYASSCESGSLVLVSKKERDSSKAKFILKLTGVYSPQTAESEYFTVYDDTQWTLALQFTRTIDRLFHDQEIVGNNTLFLYGFQTSGGKKVNNFTISASFAPAVVNAIQEWSQFPLKPFIGSYRRNFSGSVVFPTHAKFLSSKMYMNTFTPDILENHAVDVFNYGTSGSMNQFAVLDLTKSTSGIEQFVPNFKTPLFVWDFETMSGSDSNGEFIVDDFTSGSNRSSFDLTPSTLFATDEFPNRISKKFVGRGFGFTADDDSMIKDEYIMVAKNKEVGNLNANDFVHIDDDESRYFDKDIHPAKFYYTIENSMYSVINDEILNLFHSMDEFNDLIGNEYERYRDSYKSLEKIREYFFRRFQSIRRVDAYLRYYKWFDGSISEIIRQILPASMNSSQGIMNVIESHTLERNKIRHYDSFLKTKETMYEGQIINMGQKFNNWTSELMGQKVMNYTWKSEAQGGQFPQKILKIG